MVCAVIVALAGLSGGFEKIMTRLPLVFALWPGGLSQFALDVVVATPSNPALILPMLGA